MGYEWFTPGLNIPSDVLTPVCGVKLILRVIRRADL